MSTMKNVTGISSGPNSNLMSIVPWHGLLVLSYAATVVGVGFISDSLMPHSLMVERGQTLTEAPVSIRVESTGVPLKENTMQSGRVMYSGGASSSSENVIKGPL